MDTTIQTITVLVILLTLISLALASAVVIRRKGVARRRGILESFVFPLRKIHAYEILPNIIGEAIEADSPILISSGAARLGNESTIVALAAAEMAYQTTMEVSIGQTAPIFLTSETTMIPLAYDTLRKAYRARGVTVRSDVTNVRWYPAAERSLVFAAMLTTTLHSDRVTGSILVGRFGSELALPLAAMQRKGLTSIAGSDEIVGQAVAYAMSDGPLIGEDLFSAGGYLSDSASQRGSLVTQDFLRNVLIVIIILIAVVELAGDSLGQYLQPLLDVLGG